jgi:hypothetical protein
MASNALKVINSSKLLVTNNKALENHRHITKRKIVICPKYYGRIFIVPAPALVNKGENLDYIIELKFYFFFNFWIGPSLKLCAISILRLHKKMWEQSWIMATGIGTLM